MWKEFKEFAMRGNVVDMAVGIIIGAACGRLVTFLGNDLLLPLLGLLLGTVAFSTLFLTLSRTPYATPAQAKAAGAPQQHRP